MSSITSVIAVYKLDIGTYQLKDDSFNYNYYKSIHIFY